MSRMNAKDESKARFLEAAVEAVDLERFERLVQNRHSIRQFLPRPISPQLIDRLVACAHWAPNAYNLQPTHYTVVTDAEVKRQLAHCVVGTREIQEAGAAVVFSGDREVIKHHLELVIAQDTAEGALDENTAAIRRERVKRLVPASALARFGRALVAPVRRLFTTTPTLPTDPLQAWLDKQVVASASFFLLAATTAGLGAVVLDAFDAGRVRALLNIPAAQEIVLIVAIGHAFEAGKPSTRLPTTGFIHREQW